ncbi:MAG TPA: di-heme oxidoredictase family protein [Candidatus Acidoferrales bacterium]|nr:di-heme oxidoredictase family protein [Candidatus Acidoferrales bacterium]
MHGGKALRMAFGVVSALALSSVAHAQQKFAFTTVHLSGFGEPLDGVQQAAQRGFTTDLEIFATGQRTFTEVDSLPQLGPIFNSRSCNACHFQPALGGSGAFINEIRVRNNTAGGPVHIFASDNILRGGPQTQGSLTFFGNGLESSPLGCQITSPGCTYSACQIEEATRTTFSTDLPICDPTSSTFAAGANCSAERQATPLFGLGLVEAVADSTFYALAANQPPAVRGTVKTVTEFGRTRVARFGWKDDVATLRNFSGDAYLNEIGVTNPDHTPDRSTCALDQTQFGVLLDAADDPEDVPDASGRADVDLFTDFMRALAPPPALPQTLSARSGAIIFRNLGCGNCHTATLKTAANPANFIPPTTGGVPITRSLNSILAGQTFEPYSDFLLHDMGALGDGITSGAAGPTMMRTAPLWGARGKSRYLHDGRAESLQDAINFHDGQGAAARDAFRALSAPSQQRLIDFLNTI